MKEVVVYLTEDYSKHFLFLVNENLTNEEVTKIVNENFEKWFYYDINTI